MLLIQCVKRMFFKNACITYGKTYVWCSTRAFNVRFIRTFNASFTYGNCKLHFLLCTNTFETLLDAFYFSLGNAAILQAAIKVYI